MLLLTAGFTRGVYPRSPWPGKVNVRRRVNALSALQGKWVKWRLLNTPHIYAAHGVSAFDSEVKHQSIRAGS
jgi:hypothetical protein